MNDLISEFCAPGMQGADFAPVKVEVRQNSTASFGRGTTQVMPFHAFLRRFAAGDASVYLTVQDVRVATDGHPELFAPPVMQLQADVPLQPAVLGGLIPQQLNMWMGHAVEGARITVCPRDLQCTSSRGQRGCLCAKSFAVSGNRDGTPVLL